MKQTTDFSYGGKSYNTLLQPTDWRYSAAITGLVEFFTEFGIDYLVLENISDKPKTAISGFDGIVDEILEDRSKMKVIVEIFGRKTQVELSFTQVTKA